MSATVDTAVINALRNDATLTALAPGGVDREVPRKASLMRRSMMPMKSLAW